MVQVVRYSKSSVANQSAEKLALSFTELARSVPFS